MDELADNSKLDISGESNATLELYGRRRDFRHPDYPGKTRFEPHVKNFSSSRRMHVFTDFENKNICIGYFGRHLPTKSDPT